MNKTEKRPMRFFYTSGFEIYYIEEHGDELKKDKSYNIKKQQKYYNYYEAGQEYEQTLQSLMKYRTDFLQQAEETKAKLNYTKYYDHGDAVLMVFQSKSTRIMKKLNISPITYKEFPFLESCSNGGLISLDKQYQGKITNCFGYDFPAYYANILTNFELQIPIREGRRMKITELQHPLKYGIYNVKITSNHPDFYKLFSFSKKNYYTHYSIDFCNFYKDKYDIKIELINSETFNCLIWEENELEYTRTIFKDWFNHLSKLKAQFPKNRLIKRLMSSIWGTLTQYNRKFVGDDKLDNLDVSELDDPDETKYKILHETYYMKEGNMKIKYELIKSKQPYCHNLARLKPFLTSYSRMQVAQLLINENLVKNVIRIATDGIVLNKEHDFTHLPYYPKPEDKTTQKILWHNVNKYEKINDELDALERQFDSIGS